MMLFQGSAITVQLLDDHIAELTFDQSKQSVNKFSAEVVKELDEALTAIENSETIQGLIATSAKDVFIVGADIAEFGQVFESGPEAIRAMLEANNRNNKRLEDLAVPTVAAINGYALGGGLEFALACDYRVASTAASLGLPEVNLGLMPAWGGTVRLPRIAGVETALDWITGGKHYRAEQALEAGVLDELAEPEQLRATALDALKRCIASTWDYGSRRVQKRNPLPATAKDAVDTFEHSKSFAKATANPNYPAARDAATAIKKALPLDGKAALAVETEAFVALAQTSTARALINRFINDQLLASKAKSWEKQADKKIGQAAVLGAGIMGGGIAYQSALKGTPILMKDIEQSGLDLGVSEASKLLQKRVDRGAMTAAKREAVLGNIVPRLHYDGFEQVDMVVEAVVENPKVKQHVLAEVETKVSDDTVLASNTSTISIDTLAEALERPGSFCGMHFFNPVHAMPLVEVVRGTQTTDRAVARTVAYANALGKKAVVVKDCPGFLVNRVFFPYLAGFSGLVRDGVDFQTIDRVMEQWGWPMGPAYLLDVIGIDTAAHAIKLMADGYPDRMNKSFKDCIDVLYEADRYGQKNGKGFYAYSTDQKGRPIKAVSDTVYELLEPHTAAPKACSDEEIIARTMVPMATEMARCIDEGIVGTPAEADIALLYGLGFPAFRGGVFSWIDAIGVGTLCEMADRHKDLGPLYEPTQSMRDRAASGRNYFS